MSTKIVKTSQKLRQIANHQQHKTIRLNDILQTGAQFHLEGSTNHLFKALENKEVIWLSTGSGLLGC